MSELKSFVVLYDGKFIRAYEESEADKVIAELKNEIEVQKRLRDMALASVPNVLKVMKIIQHQKHKRCLAMAKVCYLRFVRYENYLQKLCASNATIAAYKFRRDMYDKWEKRWRELAAEPTWAKFLQLIHKEAK